MSEWISVDDRLPISEHEMKSNYEIEYVIVCADGEVSSGEYRCGKTIDFWYEFDGDKVTHWMPLPAPPKGK